MCNTLGAVLGSCCVGVTGPGAGFWGKACVVLPAWPDVLLAKCLVSGDTAAIYYHCDPGTLTLNGRLLGNILDLIR